MSDAERKATTSAAMQDAPPKPENIKTSWAKWFPTDVLMNPMREVPGRPGEYEVAVWPSETPQTGQRTTRPLLVRDLAELIASDVPTVCKAIEELGLPRGSTNSAIDPEDALLIAKALAGRQIRNWRTPTTLLQRMSDAVTLLCGGRRPSDAMVQGWIDNTSDELQGFAAEHGPAWAQGIGLLDAARVVANQPTEGVDHEMTPRAADLTDPQGGK